MTKFQVIRSHLSPYQSKDFIDREQRLIESLPGLSYRPLQKAEKRPTILITNTHTELKLLPPDVLEQTVLIVHPNSGYDHFTLDVELWEKIPVIIGHPIRAQAVAEYSIRALFEGLIELPQHLSWQPGRNWNRTLLKDLPLWVFGYGHIGKIIADTMALLGMKVSVVDPFIKSCPHRHYKCWQEGHVKEARAIVAAMSLNQTSHELFNKDFFSSLGEEVLFINGARGKLVHEESLRNFLLSSPRSFAFLDVFEKEPFGQEWHGFPQVWKTSHIAGVEKELDDKILDFEATVIKDFLSLTEDEFYRRYEKELLQKKWREGVLI